jgi:hypothetical protein
LKFSSPVSSYGSIRDTYRISQQTHRMTESKKSFLGLVLILFYELLSLWMSIWRFLRTKKLKAIFMTVDFLVDALFSILYLVELQYNISNFYGNDVVDKTPRWLYVNRPATIFRIAVALSCMLFIEDFTFRFQCTLSLFQGCVLYLCVPKKDAVLRLCIPRHSYRSSIYRPCMSSNWTGL